MNGYPQIVSRLNGDPHRRAMKLCKHCRWADDESLVSLFVSCRHPAVLDTNAVVLSSVQDIDSVDAYDERQKVWPFGVCGRRGAKWEPRDVTS